MNEKKMNTPLALIILDGFGETKASKGNAVTLADTPNIDKWTKEYPNILMNASSIPVGLPEGQMGNSEVGHMNMGAGRVVYQSLELINNEIKNDNLKNNKVLNLAIKHAKKNNSKLHIIGLASDGGIHSHINHMVALGKVAIQNGITNVYAHAFTDGRDVSPTSSAIYVKKLLDAKIKLASIGGRYYGMDRDKRWERMQLAYDVIVNRKGKNFTDIYKYIKDQYDQKITDEFLTPAYNSEIYGQIDDNDAVIFANFRSDRTRELSHMLVGSNEKITKYDYKSDTPSKKNLFFATMREYAGIKANILYPNTYEKNLLGEILEKNGYTQMRAAETEKYPHVTFFFDGGQEIPKKHEIRVLVSSPKVATYDLKPEMSSAELTDKIIANANGTDVFIINYAQSDMVGHTGSIPAAVKAVSSIDVMLKKLYDKIVVELKGIMIITADHGNSDSMLTKDNKPMTSHSTNPVKFLITTHDYKIKDQFKGKKVSAKLADIAPTILTILGIKVPTEMTGEILIEKN